MIMWYILRQYWETHFGNVDIFLKKKRSNITGYIQEHKTKVH